MYLSQTTVYTRATAPKIELINDTLAMIDQIQFLYYLRGFKLGEKERFQKQLHA